MNTFTDLPASTKTSSDEGVLVTNCVAGMQQSFAGALTPVA